MHYRSAVNSFLLARAIFSFSPSSERLGPAPDAIVFHHVFARGVLKGPYARLRAVRGGSEWGTLRGDGVLTVESQHVLMTERREFVFATLSGMYDLGDDGFEDGLRAGGLSGRARAEVAIRYCASGAEYRWLNRLVCIGLGERDFTRSTLSLDIYGLRERPPIASGSGKGASGNRHGSGTDKRGAQ